MATRVRDFTPERIYFITYTIYKWIKVFTDEKYFNLVYKWFDYMKNHYGNKIHGYVIMPNHLHSLVYISEYSPRFQINTKREKISNIRNYRLP